MTNNNDQLYIDKVIKGDVNAFAHLVDAYKNMGEIPVPIIVRLQGTNAVEAKTLIDESGLNVHSAVLLQEAADLVSEVL